MHVQTLNPQNSLQEVWEAQAAVVGRHASAAAEAAGNQQAVGPESEADQERNAYQAQLQRLLAADVVLVPYGILSQEVTLQAYSVLSGEGPICVMKGYQDWPLLSCR